MRTRGPVRVAAVLGAVVLGAVLVVLLLPRILAPTRPDEADLRARAPVVASIPDSVADSEHVGEVAPPPEFAPESTADGSARESGAAEAPEPVEVPIPYSGIRNGFGGGPPSPAETRVERDPATDKPIEVTAAPPPRMALGDLVAGGLGGVEGTVALTGEREAEVESGVPVALTGRVVEKESGRPVTGGTVILRSTFYTRTVFYDHHLHEVARATTDADGLFRIERLDVDPVHFGRGGLVFLSARSQEHAPLLSIPLEGVTPGYRNRLPDLVVTRARHTIRGRVLDRWEGKPVAGGRVVATGEIQPIHFPKDQREALFLSAPSAVTDEEGRFVLENVGPGKQMVSVHGGDDCAGYLQVEVPVKGEIEIRSRAIRGRIEGKVLDEWDRPVPLVRVDGGENTTHSFTDGGFVLENFRGNVLTLAFSHADYRPATRAEVPDGSRTIVVHMKSRWPLVRFRVREHATDAPVPAVSIELEFSGNRPATPTSPHYLSDVGVHAVRVPEGAAKATIAAEGFEPVELPLVGVRDGDQVPVILRRTN